MQARHRPLASGYTPAQPPGLLRLVRQVLSLREDPLLDRAGGRLPDGTQHQELGIPGGPKGKYHWGDFMLNEQKAATS